MALGGQDPPADDSEMKQKGHTKRARQYTLEDYSLIRQRNTGKLGIPTTLRQEILQEAHDSPIGGHFGAQRTTPLVQREFYWKGLAQDVKRYIRGYAVPSTVRNHPMRGPLVYCSHWRYPVAAGSASMSTS